ncbi:unnamed protein product [Kluyveromyces dobzhanskii CBS 2104]|uniref:WGS project CCBQ000000000 data, contig 00106 n=1 Tax=Kluyveromyces dobzhanskii CBS 2104 TaxID=1427455 RepID=A0A0A8L7U5_9SACH|nr:unnamed protein product [Kluyveromyces dobzhanskii CBS 2104]
MASISQPFRLSSLPKIPSLSNYANQTEYLQVVDNLSPSANKVNIGISGSSISQYLINPTPKLVFNLPIPSTNIVTACDVDENSDNLETWCYGLEARKVSHLHLATKPVIQDATSSSNAEISSKFKYKLKAKAVSIKVYSKAEKVLVVLQNGLIQTFDHELKLLNTIDISYDNVKFVQPFQDGQGNDFVFVLCQLNDNKLCYKLFQVGEFVTCIELNSIILENTTLDGAKLCYQFGKLYILKDSNELSIYQLPHLQLQSNIQLPFVSKGSVTSIKPVSSNRVLLTSDNIIYLVDLLYNAVLFEKEIKSVKAIQLLSSAAVLDNSDDNRKTIALGVSTKNGTNPSSYLDVINIDVGTGTLKDAMGKGFMVKQKRGLQKLFNESNEDEDAELPSPEYEAILKQLKTCKKAENFDSIFFKKLSLSKAYYTDNDRFLNDNDLLTQIIDALFANFKDEYPDALTYLLTHPLFPPAHSKGLLTKLKNNPRLFKQAIVTCPNVPLDDLLTELFNITNVELCFDITLRVLQDYKKESIKAGIRKIEKMDITNFLDMILSSDKPDSDLQLNKLQIFQLMSLIIDSIGLFALDDEYLEKLSSFVDAQVTVVSQNTELLHLMDHYTRNSSFINNKSNSSTHSSATQPISAYTVDYLEC